MAEMMDRVFQALLDRDLNRPEGAFPRTREEYYRDMARTALEAIREPSQAVIDCRPPFMTTGDARAMWRTMIDAALQS